MLGWDGAGQLTQKFAVVKFADSAIDGKEIGKNNGRHILPAPRA